MKLNLIALVIISLPLMGYGSIQTPTWKEAKETLPIPPQQWVDFKVYKLRYPQVVWINRDYFKRKYGIEIPRIVTPELAKDISNAVGYAIPADNMPVEAYYPNKFREAGASHYGGSGLGSNEGDGRTFTFVAQPKFLKKSIIVKIKGGGKTPLAKMPGSHGDGSAHLIEGMMEAFWSVINYRELPLGGNEVLFVLKRGTVSTNTHGETMDDALIVTEFEPRPAHYMRFWGMPTKEIEDMKVDDYILRALPGTGEKLVPRLKVYVKNMARQYGFAFGDRLYQGGTSQSNIGIQGRWVDYGTESSQRGYAPMKTGSSSSTTPAAGDTSDFKHLLVDVFIHQLNTRLTPKNQVSESDIEKLVALCEKEYVQGVLEGFLYVSGLPPNLATKLAKDPVGRRVAQAMFELATKDVTGFTAVSEMPQAEEVAAIDIRKVFISLGKGLSLGLSQDQILGGLNKEIDNKKVTPQLENLVDLYFQLMVVAKNQASEDGVSTAGLIEYIKLASAARNHDVPETYRPNLFDDFRALIEKFHKGYDPRVIQRGVDSEILKGTRNFPTENSYKLISSHGESFDATKVVDRKYHLSRPEYCNRALRQI